MLTVADVAKRLRVSRSKVYELVGARKIPHYKVDGAIRVSEDQLAEYRPRILTRTRTRGDVSLVSNSSRLFSR